MGDTAIQLENFTKDYGPVKAVKGLSLRISAGELFGLIGPDGAGKTTLMRSVCTLLKPTSGNIRVNGLDVSRKASEIRRILGYMPQRFSLYPDLSVAQNLNFFADIFQVPRGERANRMEQLYHFSRLGEFKSRAAGALSGGMKQKLALSCALIHTPEILVLDEPTFGVDPVSRQEFWEILAEIQKGGTTILVSTAYMEEADLCGRVALMHRGEILAQGTPEEVRKNFSYPLYQVIGRDLRRLQKFFRDLKSVHNTQLFGDSIHVSFSRPPEDAQWEQWRKANGESIREWKKLAPSMEDVFMELTGEERA